MEIAVLIPAYQPDSVLISLVQALHRENFRLIVTDDGSGPAYADIFSALLPYAEVLTCPENRGKGHALKCALRHLAADPQGCRAFITADADGQHTVADILRVREALLSGSRFVLTTRTLHGKSVPLRSRVGNDLSRFFFSLAAGCFLEDNQSGPRGRSCPSRSCPSRRSISTATRAHTLTRCAIRCAFIAVCWIRRAAPFWRGCCM